ncbi:MAG TPA: aminotransferase class V-fold PLP-dependent enzyme [Vicinamibacterales bacterium]|nr:aminotransferase class V-fold PLP-dependent enzyme [Vicinamibacterales bacterium]
MNKRDFLRTSAGAGLALLLGDTLWARFADLPAERLADDEAFWGAIRAKYRLKPDYINLESGYYTIQATPVLEAFIARVREINYQGSYYLRTTMVPDKAAVRDKLAAIAGCAPGELCITRNTTEAIDTVVSGYDWKPGDEAVMAEQDYGHMLAEFRLMARRHGIVNRVVSVPPDPKTDDEVVRVYAAAITPRTRLLMVSHMINVTGHILPIRKIADMAHARGVDVLVDGAHAFAQFDFKIPDLGGDYYAASLHKWLGCPLGTGILYVRREKIPALWPIYGDWRMTDDTDIMKLNHTGTHPVHTDLAINDAIAFHETIGIQRKEARLRYLQTYWTKQVRGEAKVMLNTPADPARTCAIANVGVKGVTPDDLAKTLLTTYKIWTNAVDSDPAGVHGVRVTPNMFTQPSELDTLVKALKTIAHATDPGHATMS